MKVGVAVLGFPVPNKPTVYVEESNTSTATTKMIRSVVDRRKRNCVYGEMSSEREREVGVGAGGGGGGIIDGEKVA